MTPTLVKFLRFLVVGGCGFLVDAGITHLLVHVSFSPWLARIPAIGVAMGFTWLANRHFTYRVEVQPSTKEASAYFLVAFAMALANYGLYLVLVTIGLSPVLAVTVATGCQTVASFFGYNHFVFGEKQCTHPGNL